MNSVRFLKCRNKITPTYLNVSTNANNVNILSAGGDQETTVFS